MKNIKKNIKNILHNNKFMFGKINGNIMKNKYY